MIEAHLLTSARRLDEYKRTPEQHFRCYNAAHPERGGAQKDPSFYHAGAVKAHRVMICDILNTHLEYCGVPSRIHPDALQAHGLDESLSPNCSHRRVHSTVSGGTSRIVW